MADTYIGIDNGTSGSIGIITKDKTYFLQTPKKEEQDYTKKKKRITRLNSIVFKNILESLEGDLFLTMERPLVNPKMFKATEGALRCFEAELVIIENLKIAYTFIDSKEWQRVLLPKGIRGTRELKRASLELGLRLFPSLEKEIKKQKDADGLLIALWSRKRF